MRVREFSGLGHTGRLGPLESAALSTTLSAYLDWLRAAGVALRVSPGLFEGEVHDEALIPDQRTVAPFLVPGMDPITEHRVPDAVIAADHATRILAQVLVQQRARIEGARVIDLACGTATLAVVLHRLGAAQIMATDVSEEAVRCARATLHANGAEARVFAGNMLDAVPGPQSVDWLIATLPHKPIPEHATLCLAQNGGSDGTALFRPLLRVLPQWLDKGGELLCFLHSLPTPELLREMGTLGVLTLYAWRRRVLQKGEYGALEAHFVARAGAGTSYLIQSGDRPVMICGVWGVRLGEANSTE